MFAADGTDREHQLQFYSFNRKLKWITNKSTAVCCGAINKNESASSKKRIKK